jgi:uncharacterized protein YbaA (DUF1428 family)
MAYVDGFLLQVPTKNLAAYRRMSAKAGAIWMEHGAIDYKECAGDDMNAEGMKTTFPKAMKLKPGNTLVFSWATYPSKADRARILKAVMSDPRMKPPKDMPFDPASMLYGGFDVIVDMAPGKTPATKKRAMPAKRAAKKKSKR